jgi:hypothetical protein
MSVDQGEKTTVGVVVEVAAVAGAVQVEVLEVAQARVVAVEVEVDTKRGQLRGTVDGEVDGMSLVRVEVGAGAVLGVVATIEKRRLVVKAQIVQCDAQIICLHLHLL